MAKTVLYMSMSLDGFITGPDDGVEHPLGRGGFRLHDWFPDGNGDPKSFRPSAQPSAQVFDELMDTAAVITGRRTFDLAHGWNGDHHDGVPVFVLTHTAPEDEPAGHVRYVTDLESCVTAAKTAAGEGNILVHGAYTAQRMLRAGLLDEMEIHLIPVLLGQGRRLFDADNPQHTELELVRALNAPDVMHLHYRVQQHS